MPALTTGLEEQQRLLVELYRRVNPAVVSIDVAGQHPEAEGAPAPDQDIPFAQGSGFLYDDQGHLLPTIMWSTMPIATRSTSPMARSSRPG